MTHTQYPSYLINPSCHDPSHHVHHVQLSLGLLHWGCYLRRSRRPTQEERVLSEERGRGCQERGDGWRQDTVDPRYWLWANWMTHPVIVTICWKNAIFQCKKRDYSLTSWPEFSVIIHWQNIPFLKGAWPQDFTVPLLVSGSHHLQLSQVLEESIPWAWNQWHATRWSWSA